MKSPQLATALALLPTALACAGALPEPFPAARYEKMLADSPFALATVDVPKGPEEPPWSANLILGPVWQVGLNGEEIDCAVVKSKGDISGSFTLMGHQPGPDGIELVRIEWADDITKTKAVVKKGTETATLDADQTAAPAAPPQPQIRPNGQPGVPAINGANPNLIRRPGQAAVPPHHSPPHVRPACGQFGSTCTPIQSGQSKQYPERSDQNSGD